MMKTQFHSGKRHINISNHLTTRELGKMKRQHLNGYPRMITYQCYQKWLF
ncbi:Uncharacterised protein [Kluyvera ascorbata]|nr:Uncharacterised protein [Kluyvera ascorbata]